MYKIKGEASSSTLVEDLASHAKERQIKLKVSIKWINDELKASMEEYRGVLP